MNDGLSFVMLEDKTYGVCWDKKTEIWDLVIPDRFLDIPVTMIINQAFSQCKTLRSVVIPDSITKVGYACFDDCEKLENVKLSSRLEHIGAGMFKDCYSIHHINLPESIHTIHVSAFKGTDIEEIIIPDGVSRIETGAFGDCKWLSKVKLPKNLKTLEGYTFLGCSSLTHIELPTSIENLNNSSLAATALEHIEIPHGVSIIGPSLLSHCKHLLSINLPSTITWIREFAFWQCDKLQSINYNGSKEQFNRIKKDKNAFLDIPKEAYINCIDGRLEI